MAYQGEIAVAAVNEDALLDVSIALLCIVVQLAQALLRHVVIADVPSQLLITLGQHAADILGEHQTGVAPLLTVLRRHHVRHRFQALH